MDVVLTPYAHCISTHEDFSLNSGIRVQLVDDSPSLITLAPKGRLGESLLRGRWRQIGVSNFINTLYLSTAVFLLCQPLFKKICVNVINL